MKRESQQGSVGYVVPFWEKSYLLCLQCFFTITVASSFNWLLRLQLSIILALGFPRPLDFEGTIAVRGSFAVGGGVVGVTMMYIPLRMTSPTDIHRHVVVSSYCPRPPFRTSHLIDVIDPHLWLLVGVGVAFGYCFTDLYLASSSTTINIKINGTGAPQDLRPRHPISSSLASRFCPLSSFSSRMR